MSSVPSVFLGGIVELPRAELRPFSRRTKFLQPVHVPTLPPAPQARCP